MFSVNLIGSQGAQMLSQDYSGSAYEDVFEEFNF